MRARVGAMPQPKSSQQHYDHNHPSSAGRGNRVRVHSGMSLEDLKRETAQRLAHEGGQSDGGDESSENNIAPAIGGSGSGGATEHSSQSSCSNNMHYQHSHYPQGHQYPREPAVSVHYGGPHMMSPQTNHYPQRGGRGDYGPPSYGYNDLQNNYSNEPRNYTDSQLGVGGVGAGGQGNMAQYASPPPPPPPSSYRHSTQPLQQQYSTPRMPRHATVLKDRGSAENSVGSSDPSGGSENMGYGYGGHRGNAKASAASPAMKGNHRVGSHSKNLNKAGRVGPTGSAKPQPKEMRSPDGRHTPVRDRNLEGQVLFATPSRRDVPSTPTSVYSEPPRSKAGGHIRPHPTMSPNYNHRMRSPDHHAGNYSRGVGGGAGGGGAGGPYSQRKDQLNKHQSKLPHGLTVQELKEMTRARLAAEAEIGGPEQGGSSDQSVHSAGTHTSSKASDQFSSGRGSNLAQQTTDAGTRNLVQTNESYANQGLNSQPFQGQQPQMQPQMQPQPQNPPHHFNNYPRHPSPVFGAGGPQNHQFNGNQPPPHMAPRQLSPAFGLSSSQTRSQMQGDTWETASAASSTVPMDSGFHTGNNVGGGGSGGASTMPFSSPMSDSNAMTFNRGRCFSAGATMGIQSSMQSSFEQNNHHLAYQGSYYENVPLTGDANRQRCATVSPPGMSRLHEDRPYLFSSADKDRLAIPPLSEPRLRLHSTGGLNTHGTAMRAFNSGMSSPPPGANSSIGSGSAFVPISKNSNNEQFLPASPPSLNVDRSKFGVGDRTISSSSAASAGHGDLPSSMAEAVLESITSTSAPMGNIGGQVIGTSPFRPSEQGFVGESPFRVSDSSENASSAFRLDGLLPESSGSMSLFSSGESRNIFSHENSSERMLLGTHSWGGAEDDATHSNAGLSHDFSNLLNLSGGDNSYCGQPALRGRAATEPVWFGGNDPLLVSRIDPEHNADQRKAPPRVSSLVDTNGHAASNNFTMHDNQQGRKPDGC